MSCNPSTVTVTRGATFLVLASIPDIFPDGHFAAYTVESQLRTPKRSLLAELVTEWSDPITTRILKLRSDATADWPVGMGTFDIVFTSPSGDRLFTGPQAVVITQGVTEP